MSQRQFATDVVKTLRDAGFKAYWAGGCVRDDLLGRTPKDFDVATDAPPDEIRRVFGRKRTLAIGAAFGVITVLGTKRQGQIEVATFRQDATYSDGRHPDSVKFSTPEEDAQRRDFTINGLFYDPVDQQVIDFVGGQADLQAKIVRAIGDADARINEDKLRMLRAVRFAATYAFELEAETLAALARHAEELSVVSAERITEEMRRMLRHAQRARAVRLLRESKLLAVVLPRFAERIDGDEAVWDRTIAILDALQDDATFTSALAVLLRDGESAGDDAVDGKLNDLSNRWRLSNDELQRVRFLLTHETNVRSATNLPWPKLQRILITDGSEELVDYCASVAKVLGENDQHIAFCREKLAQPAERLNPPPLITGDDLRAAGIPPGKAYRKILDDVRDAQLVGEIESQEDALQRAVKLWKS